MYPLGSIKTYLGLLGFAVWYVFWNATLQRHQPLTPTWHQKKGSNNNLHHKTFSSTPGHRHPIDKLRNHEFLSSFHRYAVVHISSYWQERSPSTVPTTPFWNARMWGAACQDRPRTQVYNYVVGLRQSISNPQCCTLLISYPPKILQNVEVQLVPEES